MSVSPRLIVCQYPPLWLTRGSVTLCKPHMLELHIDGGWRVDSCNVAFKNKIDYKVTHLSCCAMCEQRQEGDATQAKILNLAKCFYLNNLTDEEYDELSDEEEPLTKTIIQNNAKEGDNKPIREIPSSLLESPPTKKKRKHPLLKQKK